MVKLEELMAGETNGHQQDIYEKLTDKVLAVNALMAQIQMIGGSHMREVAVSVGGKILSATNKDELGPFDADNLFAVMRDDLT